MPSTTGLLKSSLAVTAVLISFSLSTFAIVNDAQTATAATHFSVVAPSSEISGGEFNFTVKALDASGKVVTGYAGTMHFTSSDSKAILPASSKLSSGTGTFHAALVTAGKQSIRATDTGTSSITGVSNSITISVATVSEVAEMALTQTGLGIAFASNVLQSQLDVVFATATKSQPCSVPSGGSYGYKTGSTPTVTLRGQSLYPVTIYFDTKCTKPYIAADITGATPVTDGVKLQETATYHDLNGATLGLLKVNEMLTSTPKAIVANGLGIFTPASGARTPVQLGLYCTMPTNGGHMPCGGGVAQDIHTLKLAVGAVTPLTLVPVKNSAGKITKLSFSGSGSVVTGPIGSLKLTNPVTTKLVVQGGKAFATTTAKGSAGGFDLFPPTPTSWTLTDAAHNERILISVIDDTTRESNITITQISTGDTLAIGRVDQAGTGSITFSGGTFATITSWTLEE